MAEVAGCLGIYHGAKKLGGMYAGDLGLHTRPTVFSWDISALKEGFEERKRLALAECGNSVLSVAVYALYTKISPSHISATKFGRPAMKTVALLSLVCLNYGTAKLAYTVQKTKEQLFPVDNRHAIHDALAGMFDENLSAPRRSKEFNISTLFVDSFLQPVVEGIMVHKYLFLRLLPLVGPLAACTGTAITYSLIHTDFSTPQNSKSLFLTMADSTALQIIFSITGGSAFASIFVHIAGSMVGAMAAASDKNRWDRYEENFLWRYVLSYLERRRLIWHSCIVPKGTEESIYLNLMPFAAPDSVSMQGTDKNRVERLCSYLFECYRQPGELKLSTEDAADFMYAFRTAVHAQHVDKFNRTGKSGSLLGVGISRHRPHYRIALPALICSDQTYLEAHRHFPNGMDLNSMIKFVLYESCVGNITTSPKKKTNFTTLSEVESMCAANGPLCKFCGEPSELEEEEAIRIVDEYYKDVRTCLLEVSHMFIEGVTSELDQNSCDMPDVESLLEGLSRSESNELNTLLQTDEQYYTDMLDLYARRASISYLQKYGYTIRRWKVTMEKLDKLYPRVAELRASWNIYFRSREFKFVAMNIQNK